MNCDALTIVVLIALGALFLEVWWICECSGVNKKFDRIVMAGAIVTIWFILCCGLVSGSL